MSQEKRPNQLTKFQKSLPAAFETLKEYVVALTPEYVVFEVPINLICCFDENIILSYFDDAEISRNRNSTAQQVKCYFRKY